MSTRARKLQTRMVEKIWGRDDLPAPFTAPEGRRIGEIWFEPPEEMPELLVKYLFTSEKLSVQVHPGDETALEGEDAKEECWLVLDAEPGAQLALGFTQTVSAEAIETAARDGSIEQLLAWHDVKAGDIYYLPSGTVHAIGPGISLVEVQQNSDTTFRLYDYGRPRDLHLDRAMAVALGKPYPRHLRSTFAERGSRLLESSHFRIDRVEGAPGEAERAAYAGSFLALPLAGHVAAKDAAAHAGPGECLYCPAMDEVDFTDAEVTLLVKPAG